MIFIVSQAIDKAFVPDICKASKGKQFDDTILNQVMLMLEEYYNIHLKVTAGSCHLISRAAGYKAVHSSVMHPASCLCKLLSHLKLVRHAEGIIGPTQACFICFVHCGCWSRKLLQNHDHCNLASSSPNVCMLG